MPFELSKKRRVEILRALGEPDAERWAEDGAQSVARWLLLRALWRAVIAESDACLGSRSAGEPVGAGVRRILDAGARAEDLTLVVRQMQVQALFDAVQSLDGASHGIEDLQAKIPENVEWRVCAYDGERAEVGPRLGELHGAFLRMDPAGRMGEAPRETTIAKKTTTAKTTTAKTTTTKRTTPRRPASAKRAVARKG